NATPADIVRAATASLQPLFGKGLEVARQLEGYHYHDWQQDPYACGAYSYVTVGGDDARETLARPLDATLHFAGEATDTAREARTTHSCLAKSRSRPARPTTPESADSPVLVKPEHTVTTRTPLSRSS